MQMLVALKNFTPPKKYIIFHIFLHDSALLILISANKLKCKRNIFWMP